jgi:uncharacterized protein
MSKTFKWSLFGLFLILFSLPVSAQAATVDDQAQLFTAEQIQELEEQAAPLNEEIKGNVFIVTTATNTEEPRDFADNYLRQQIGNDQNGSVLLLDMNQRQIYISTSGNMIDYLTDSRIDSILDDVYNQMTNQNYFEAAKAYLTETQEYVEDGVPGDHYRVDEETGEVTRYNTLTRLEIIVALALAAGASLAFYFITISKYQLKFKTYKYPFREKASLKLTDKTDRLTNSFVTTRRIPKSPPPGSGGGGSTTHSSGGGTFGGGGRGF